MTAALTAMFLLPLLASAAIRAMASRERARSSAILAATLTLGLAVAVFVASRRDDAFGRIVADSDRALLGVHYHLGVDGLSSLLLPLTAAVALISIVVTPRTRIDGRSAAQILLTEAGLLGCLVSLDAGLLTFFWTLSLLPLLSVARASRDHALARAATVALVGSVAPLLVATIALGWLGVRAGLSTPLDLPALARASGPHGFPPAIGVLVIVAALFRVGIFPAHGWLPVIVERGPMHMVLVALVTPLGSFLLARMALPLTPDLFAHASAVLAPLGAVTAVYGALLAVGQHDLRRLVGFFFVSQSGFVLAGISTRNAPSVAGSLLQAMATVVSVTGLLLVVSAIEARASTVDMRRLGGLVASAPRMATTFLLLSAAAVGFPGTVGFVSEDLLVQGILRGGGILAATLLVVTAINGVTLIRAYKRTFLGPHARHADDLRSFPDFLVREQWAAVAIVVALLAGGFAAAPVLSVRSGLRGLPLGPTETHAAPH